MSDTPGLPPDLAEMKTMLDRMEEQHHRMLEAAFIYATTYKAMLNVFEGHLTVALHAAEREIARRPPEDEDEA